MIKPDKEAREQEEREIKAAIEAFVTERPLLFKEDRKMVIAIVRRPKLNVGVKVTHHSLRLQTGTLGEEDWKVILSLPFEGYHRRLVEEYHRSGNPPLKTSRISHVIGRRFKPEMASEWNKVFETANAPYRLRATDWQNIAFRIYKVA